MGARTTPRGFSVLEISLVVGISALFLATFGEVLTTSDGLAQTSRITHRAQEELRMNLEAVANVLRSAELESLGNFGADGVATNPTFGRVVGVDAVGRLYDGSEELRWVATSEKVPGVAAPGQVIHYRDGVPTVVGRRVPSGGFRVQIDAGILTIWMRTYYQAEHEVRMVEGQTAVSLRN